MNPTHWTFKPGQDICCLYENTAEFLEILVRTCDRNRILAADVLLVNLNR